MSAGTGTSLAPPADAVEEALRAAAPDTDGAIVIVEDAAQAEVRYANNTTTTNGVRSDRRVTVICFRQVPDGTAVGITRRSGAADLSDMVKAAVADASGSPPAEDAAPLLTVELADRRAGAPPFGTPPGTTDLAVLEPVLRELADAFKRARGSDRVLAGFAEHGVSTTYLGTSTGVRLRHEQPTGALHLVARGTEGRRSAWAGAGTADFSDVSVAALEERLVERLALARNQIDLPAGRYETILPPDAVADLMTYLVESAGGRDAEDGRSVFSRPGGGTRVGDTLSSLPFELRGDPAEPGLECASFLSTPTSGPDVSVFDNGASLARTAWVEGGKLARLQYHRAGATRSGTHPATMIDNLVLELPGATGSVDDLVGRTERGLLLTCLWYIREVDPATLLLTGLTRDGVYLVEDGRITGAVNNFRFNESPVDLLSRVAEAGSTQRCLGREFGEWLNRTAMPPLRVPDFNMSSVSQAS
jgi:predicted Zn-dependent protease